MSPCVLRKRSLRSDRFITIQFPPFVCNISRVEACLIEDLIGRKPHWAMNRRQQTGHAVHARSVILAKCAGRDARDVILAPQRPKNPQEQDAPSTAIFSAGCDFHVANASLPQALLSCAFLPARNGPHRVFVDSQTRSAEHL